MTLFYILEGHTPRRTELEEWTEWMARANRQVAEDFHEEGGTMVRISTVFLGIDHAFFVGEPVLFETMVFGGQHDELQRRCSTWEQAEAMHREVLEVVRG